MSRTALKEFQTLAVQSGVEVFAYTRTLLDAAGTDVTARATAIRTHGTLLLEAPTGAGKTLIAGNIAERFAHGEDVVWFWFAPFRGVVEQTAATLRAEFAGLRVRELSGDRDPSATRGGDVFITTWGAVATKVADQRNVRRSGELLDSVDEFLNAIRAQGLRVGVVVDEAHHGFHGQTQAAEFFRSALRPYYTILITATPDDNELADLQRKAHLGEMHRITISRADAVASGLVKDGVRCIAWQAAEGREALVDFEGAALAEATKIHREIKTALAQAGISLVPLMLVQVDSKERDSVAVAKARLLKLGFTEAQIATHTAAEPDAGLLALANDEFREVLIFKLAVALGFDAPRAFTLVSMRPSRDEDFGVQLVGRILRVHRRLQGIAIPEALRYGYVLLADSTFQPGIAAAGQRINALRTAYAKVSTSTVIVRVGDRATVQVLSSTDPTPTFFPDEPRPFREGGGEFDLQLDGGETTVGPATNWFPETNGTSADSARAATPSSTPKKHIYPLQPGVPRVFTTQRLPDDFRPTEEECARLFIVSTESLLEVLSERVQVQRRTLDVFTGALQAEFDFARFSGGELSMEAQRILRSDVFDRRALWQALLARLSEILRDRGFEDAENSERVKSFLEVLLVTKPDFLRNAQRVALAKGAQFEPAAELPNELDSDDPLEPSLRNIYRCIPPGLNLWETDFVRMLDQDATGKLLWWHRNPARKDHSACVLLANGTRFFPDFILGIQGRPQAENGLLADTKYAFETRREIPKMLAEHDAYGRVLILSKENDRWFIAKLDASGRAMLGEEFRIVNAAGY